MNDNNKMAKELAAEFLGTFTLVFVGAAAVVVAPIFGLVVPALAHGLILVGLIYAYNDISGAHFNPAVTVALLVGRQIDAVKAVLYIVIQFVAGIVATYALVLGLGGAENPALLGFLGEAGFNYGQTTGFLTADYVWSAALLEAILVFFLISTIYRGAVFGRIRDFAGIAIGFTLAGSIFAGGALTGASLNPARTLGPALAAGDLSYILPYFVGLFAGGIIAGLVHGYVLASPPEPEPIMED